MDSQSTDPHNAQPQQDARPQALPQLCHEESGQDLVEYALIAMLIGLAAVTSAHGVAVSVSSAINIVGSSLTSSL